MGASVDRIRRTMHVERTPRDKGLELTIRVVAYDNGMLELDGVPINSSRDGYDPVDGWLGTAEVITATLVEFRRQVQRRAATPVRDDLMSIVLDRQHD
jgi:hypothetical protein